MGRDAKRWSEAYERAKREGLSPLEAVKRASDEVSQAGAQRLLYGGEERPVRGVPGLPSIVEAWVAGVFRRADASNTVPIFEGAELRAYLRKRWGDGVSESSVLRTMRRMGADARSDWAFEVLSRSPARYKLRRTRERQRGHG